MRIRLISPIRLIRPILRAAAARLRRSLRFQIVLAILIVFAPVAALTLFNYRRQNAV